MKKLVVAALMALAFGGAAQATELSPACKNPGKPVDEQGYVAIGGIQQWVVVEGQACANPVVLIVHGGPGNPNTPFAHALFGDWAKTFTIVQWDQRGSGKTYEANKPAEDEPLTMDRLTADGVEMARWAQARFGQRQVILMGGSWGSALATHMAMAAPKLFSAYVGTGQLVDYQADVKISYARATELAKAAGDEDSLTKLAALGPPPWTNPRAFGVLRRITRKYEALKTDPPPKGWFAFAPGYDTPAYEAAYEAGEDYSFFQFVGPKGDGIGPGIDLRKLGMRFEMPVYLIQGEEDLVTPPEVSKPYFDEITAPKKEYLPLARVGHDPNPAMLAAQYRVLETVKAEAGR